ncbi:MAG: SAM-dependent methyltransferase, partial [Thermoplasmata archaeon]|nr:SAM-dependent methyltransferase [Thermoplasmata archaeon]
MPHPTGCPICGKELKYLDRSEPMECHYCKEQGASNTRCVYGHFICDSCHSSSANDMIEKFCITTTLCDPIEIMMKMMRHPSVKMHGPEHHFLVPAALLAAYYNVVGDEEGGKGAREESKQGGGMSGESGGG